MSTMYDSVTASSIPADAQIVAGYVDGLYAWSDADWARFPTAQKVTITVLGAPGALVADCEQGDLTTDQAASWAASEMAQGRHPTIYCSRAVWDLLKESCAALGIAPDYWIADWTYQAHLIPGSVATQWADPPQSGGQYDISTTAADWPVAPPVPPPLPQGEGMIAFGTVQGPSGPLDAITYEVPGQPPVLLVQTSPGGQGSSAGGWEWFAFSDPKVTQNGTPPASS